MNAPKRKISDSYHNLLISLGQRHKYPEFRKLISEPEALNRIREIREEYDINTFIDISVLVPICSNCKQSADRQAGEHILPEVSLLNWQTHYKNIGIDPVVIEMIDKELASLFCFSCQSQISFTDSFIKGMSRYFYIFSTPILEFFGCKSSLGKRPHQWMKDALLKICGEKCTSCNADVCISSLTFDHIIPKSQGGEANFLNLQLLCQKCNANKSDTVPKFVISHITAELFPPNVDSSLASTDKRIDFSGDDRSHPLAQYFYEIN